MKEMPLLDEEQIERTFGTKVGASGYYGVGWHPRSKKWRAQIMVTSKPKKIILYLGLFPTAKAAAIAYNAKAKELGGKRHLNAVAGDVSPQKINRRPEQSKREQPAYSEILPRGAAI